MKFKKAESKIHGHGLFANKYIGKGEKIGSFEVKRTSDKDGLHTIWLWRGNSLKPFRAMNDLRFANHSSAPNAEVIDIDMFATKPIEAGEEITFHYGEDWD